LFHLPFLVDDSQHNDSCPTCEVQLLINGVDQGRKAAEDCVFLWENVPLQEGENRVEVKGSRSGKALHDENIWTFKPEAPTEVYVAQHQAMREAELIDASDGDIVPEAGPRSSVG
jgi:hypothetical protein